MSRRAVLLMCLAISPALAWAQLSGGLPALKEDIAAETAARQQADAAAGTALQAEAAARQAGDATQADSLSVLAERVKTLEALVAQLRVELVGEFGNIAWADVYFHDLASQPPGSVVRNGGYLWQGVTSAYGRTCWLQNSDWSQLAIPIPSAVGDAFAFEADVYIPQPPSGWVPPSDWRFAGLQPFAQAFVDPPSNNFGIGFGGGSEGARIHWQVHSSLFRVTPIASMWDGWRRVRVEVLRSSCAFRVLVEGKVADSWQGTCDLSGAYISLVGNVSPYQSAQVAWSNLRIQIGSVSAQ